MQNITAARLLPGFLRPAVGEWCAPLSLGQALSLLSRLRFSAAWVAFGVRERGPAEVGWDWLWALPPTVSERESVKASQREKATSEVTPGNKDVGFVHLGQEAETNNHCWIGTRTVGLQNTSNKNFIG